MSAVTHAILAAGVGAGATSAAASSASSAQGFWALINQYQLFLLFPFFQTYMPADLEYYLIEFEIFSVDFSFLDKFEIPWIEGFVFKLDYDQKDSTFKNNGFNSGAFVINHFSMFKALFIIFICNMIFLLFHFIFRKRGKSGR